MELLLVFPQVTVNSQFLSPDELPHWQQPSKNADLILPSKPRLTFHGSIFHISVPILLIKPTPQKIIPNAQLTQNKSGMGMHTSAANANTLHAHWSPSLANMAGLNSGNAAANIDRLTMVAATALAK
jgi:hypothetical protein